MSYPAFYAMIEDYKTRPFEWGEADCCLFVADALAALYGKDYAAPFRGKYTTEKGAYKLLKKYDGIEGYLDGLFERVPVAFAQRGDIIKVGDTAFSVGIVSGREAYFMDVNGVKNIPTSKGVIAWRTV